jgi:uncharacterized repeat protein (TIGR01451 family)
LWILVAFLTAIGAVSLTAGRAFNSANSNHSIKTTSSASGIPASMAITTIVNYDFNAGSSYATLTPTLAAGVLSQASSTEAFSAQGGTATSGAAFTANATAGNAIEMSNSSGTNTRNFQFALTGSSLPTYSSYKVYLQARRNATGAQTVTLAYSTDGVNFTNFPTTLSLPTQDVFAAQVFDLSAITALNGRNIVYFQVRASGASGTGSLRIDNFQVQADSITPVAPVIAGNKTAMLAPGGDVNSNGFINPGDKLMYSVTFTNTGTNATNVVFTDQLNANLTLEPGSVNASPIAVNDSYTSIGNVGINVNTNAAGLLGNDIDPNGNTLTVTGVSACSDNTAPFACTTANGGTINVQANGQFTYLPAPGFEGNDFFIYSISDGQSPAKTDIGTATITVSGMIWFVDNNAGGGGDGRLGSPFNSISSFNSTAADDPGDTIFLYRQTATNYTGPLTLLNNQKLGGQGMTVPLAGPGSFTGFTIPSFSNTLPTTSGTRPIIAVQNGGSSNHNLTVATGNTLRGFDLQTTTTGGNSVGAALFSTSFNNLTASEISINASANQSGNCVAAISLDQGASTAAINASFTSVSSNNCSNGIVLADTTGSFTVTGNAGTCTLATPTCTGGRLQNTSGGNTSSATPTGTGIVLNNTNMTTLSFNRMRLDNHTNYGIRGTSVTNFTFADSVIDASVGAFNGNDTANDEGCMRFTNLLGTNSISNSDISRGYEDIINIVNSSSTAGTLNITNTKIHDTNLGTMPLVGNSGVNVVAMTSANLTINITSGSDIRSVLADCVIGRAQDNATLNLTANGSTFLNSDEAFDLAVSQNGDMNYDINGCTMTGHTQNTIQVVLADPTSGSSVNGTIRNNTIGDAAVVQSGSKLGFGINMDLRGNGASSQTIHNNTISHTDREGIYIVSRGENSSAVKTGQHAMRITNNTINSPDDDGDGPGGNLDFPFGNINGLYIETDNGQTFCLQMSGNNSQPKAPALAGTRDGYRLRQRQQGAASVFRIQGLTPTSGATAAQVQTYVAGQNPLGNSVFVVPASMTTIVAYTAGTCTTPAPLRAPISEAGAGNQAKAAPSGAPEMGVFARLRQMLRPVFSAFATPAGYFNISKISDQIAPAAAAAEFVVPSSGGSDSNIKSLAPEGGTPNIPALPAKTMVVNGRGEARMVPTSAMAGELITVPNSGSFTLPAGKSVTVMFNATIGASFAGTSIANQATLSGNFGSVMSNNLMTPVIQPPTIAKQFGVPFVSVGGSTSLSFTLTNPNPSQSLSQVTFIDNLPAGLVVAMPNGVSNACGGSVTATAGTGVISLTGGSIAAGGNCSITVNVTGTTEGVKMNSTGAPDSLESDAGVAGTANLSVINPPTLAKSFTPSSVPVGSTSTLQFTLSNPNTTQALNTLTFTDTLPAGVTAPNTASTTVCTDGSYSISSNVISFTKPSLATGGSCVFSVTVTGTTAGAKNNTTSTVTTTNSNAGTAATATLNVFGPPTITKAFSPTSIPLNGVSTLTINITNPAGNPGGLTGIAVSDSLPAGLEVDATPGATNTCGGTFSPVAAATSISLTGGAIATAGNSCSISVKIKGTTAGVKNNTTGAVSSTNGGTGSTASATLNVFAPPTVAKAFSPTGVAVNGISTLTITITNPAANPGGVTGVAISDTFPGGLEVDATPGATNTCGGTFSAAAAATSVSLTGGAIATPGNSCAISVKVKATTSGVKNNTTGAVSSTEGGTGGTASASLTVATPPTVAKSFSPTQVALNGISTLTINFTNPNALALSGLAISDTFPAGVEVDTTPGPTNTCGGTFTPTAGATSISLTGGSLATSGSCAISVKVKGTTAGVKNNTTGNVSTTESGAGGTANATLTVVGPPSFSKAFTPPSIPLGSTSSLGFTITNSNTTVGLSGISFTDTLPANLIVSDATTNDVCGTGSTLTVTAATRTIALTGGNLAAGSPNPTTCNFSVTVGASAAGSYTNTVSSISSTEGGTNSTPATATLTVVAPPVIAKSFSPTGVQVNGVSTLTIAITNPAANTAALTGVSVSDTFPAELEVNATPGATNSCSTGTFAPAAGNTSLTISGATIPVGTTCNFSVQVKATTPGQKLNTTGNVMSANGGMGATASATLNVAAAPTVTKSFSPTSVAVGGTSTLTLNFANPNALALSGLAISDSFPAGVEVDATPAATNTCGGTFNPTAGATSVSLTGGSLTTSGSCAISVKVKATTGGVKNNTTGNVSTTESGSGSTASATLNVFAPPTIAKQFSPTSVPLNGISTLTITITNPASNPGALNGIAVSDSFPAGVQVDTTPTATNTCGGTFSPSAGATSISLTGGAIATAGNSCSISVKVKGTTAGAKSNTTGNVSSTEGGTGGTANATLNVFAPPTVTKAFSPTGVAINGISTLTITITNPAGNPGGVTGVAISDTFPAGVEVDATPGATNSCGGTFTPVAAATSVSLTGGAIASAGGSCSISVKVKGTTAGVKNNTTGNVSSTEGGAGATASATLNVAAAPTLTKSFSPTSVAVGGTSTLTINFTNPNASVALSNLSISDSLPAGLEVDATPAATNTCGGTFNPTAGATSISVTGGSLTTGGSCAISVKVKGTTAGVKNNTTGNVSTTESGSGGTASATLNVFGAPTIAKAFSPTGVALGGVSTLTITLTNPAANPGGLTGIAVSDNFPAGLEVDATPTATNTCGGTFSPSAGATSISLTGAAIATAGNNCAISVKVKGTTAGAKNNTTGAVSSTNGGTGGTASATLNVFAPPTVAKAFSPTTVTLNGISTLTITFTNPAANPGGLTGVGIVDNFPAGLQVDATPAATNSCGGTFSPTASATSITFSGGAIATAGNSCSISVKVKGVTSGQKNNTTNAVTSTNGGTGGTASATLNVGIPPTITKAFGATDIALNGTTSLTFTINNPNTIPLTGISFTDSLPAGLVVATPNGLSNTCGGTVTATAGSGSISLSGGTTSASGSCSISLNVKGSTAGAKNNTTGLISSTETGPGATSNTATVTVRPISGSIQDPATCLGPGGVVGVTASVTNSAAASQSVAFTATLPAQLLALPGTCTASTGSCTVVNSSTVTWTGTLSAGQSLTIHYQAQVANGAVNGAQLCINSAATFNGGTPVPVTACTTVTCQSVGPGQPNSDPTLSDQKPGSVLIYNYYTSNATSPNSQNSRINMTNVNPAQPAFAHLFFVDGATCSIADSLLCLTPNQTASFLASDIDPGTSGYLVVVAVDSTGCPINFNYLIGDSYVKLSSGHEANLAAESIPAIAGGLTVCDENSVTAKLNFDGVSYSRLPRALAVDNIPSRGDGNDTLIVLNRIGGNLAVGAATLSNIFGIFYNDQEVGASFGFNPGMCQFRSSINNSFPRISPRFEQFVPAGHSGWLKLYSLDDQGLLGAAINFNPNSRGAAGAFSQGHNLHKLTLTSSASIIIPVLPPSC